MMIKQSAKKLVIFGLVLFLVGLIVSSGSFSAEGPEAIYQEGYLSLKKAERNYFQKDYEKALTDYKKAAISFQEIKTGFPEWSPDVIKARLEKCQVQIKEVEKFGFTENSWEHPLKVHFIDVGQGDSILIQCPDGTTLLIDAGKIWCYTFLSDYLRRSGVDRIDFLIVSHPHGDHYGGLIEILKIFPVETILVSGQVDTTDLYQRFMEALKGLKRINYKIARAGDRYSFGGVEFLIMHPSTNLPDSLNNCSIIAKLTYGEISFLFTGDAEEEAELEVISRGYDINSTILKVAHHGSHTSTDQYFLSRVSPDEAVISVGEDNVYGHPSPQVIRRLKRGGIKTYRTDRDGTILYICNGRENRVKFPGKAVYPEYDIPPESQGKIIADLETLIYYKPGDKLARRIPPSDRIYFDTVTRAEAAGYCRAWY